MRPGGRFRRRPSVAHFPLLLFAGSRDWRIFALRRKQITLMTHSPLAPILLFVYNRPAHTRRLVESLLRNAEAAESTLFVYSDAPRDEAGRFAAFYEWAKRARWCVDGKFYTSSGISAGMDMALGFIADRFGEEKANGVAKYAEYVRNADPENDPFAR